MSDSTREFVPGIRAFKRDRSLSVVFGFKGRKSENPATRRRAQLTRGHTHLIPFAKLPRHIYCFPTAGKCSWHVFKRSGRVCRFASPYSNLVPQGKQTQFEWSRFFVYIVFVLVLKFSRRCGGYTAKKKLIMTNKRRGMKTSMKRGRGRKRGAGVRGDLSVTRR